MAKPRLADERDFIPTTLEEVISLREAVIEAGATPQESAGLVAFVIDAGLGLDRVSGYTKTRYRRILAALDGSYPGPRRRRRKVDVTPPYLSPPSPDNEPIAA